MLKLISIVESLGVPVFQFRVAVYYSALKQMNNNDFEGAAKQIDGWMDTDLSLILSYRDYLSESDRARVDGLLIKVAEQRQEHPKEYHVSNSEPFIQEEKQKISIYLGELLEKQHNQTLNQDAP